MTKYGSDTLTADQEGKRCTVADLRIGKVLHGVIIEVDRQTERAVVQYDSGSRVSVGWCFVKVAEDD